MRIRKSFFLAFSAFALLITYLHVTTHVLRISNGRKLKSEISKVNHSSIFIYRAYYDDRAVKNTIRILAISKCLSEETKLTLNINGILTPLTFHPIEGVCPWTWAKKCQWNAYEFQSIKIIDVPDHVEISINNERVVIVKVERIGVANKGKLQVCVPPLYWYHDWSRLILFFELWRKHNATFIMYANSISASSAKGVVQVVNWPILPVSANGEDPNIGVYRLSHSLAHNDCVLRMTAEYGVLLDVDEGYRSLLDYVKPRFENDPHLGSLLFHHFGLKVGHLNGSFDGIIDAEIFNNNRPTKTVFKPEFVRFLSTHSVNIHEPKSMRSRKVPTIDGKLLHYRQNFYEMDPKNTTKLSDLELRNLQKHARDAAKIIFGDKMPTENSEASKIIEQCMSKWRFQGCKVPLLHCRKDIESTDDWVFLPPSHDSFYRLL